MSLITSYNWLSPEEFAKELREHASTDLEHEAVKRVEDLMDCAQDDEVRIVVLEEMLARCVGKLEELLEGDAYTIPEINFSQLQELHDDAKALLHDGGYA